MSNYFSGVCIGGTIEKISNSLKAGTEIRAGTYLGIAPELTTVLYAPDDRFGMVAAIASLIPIGICVALLTVFLCRRTAEDLWVGVGQIGCEIVNGIVKLIVRQPRPCSPVTNMPADSYGMPSAHSQYMGYFAAVSIMQSLNAKGISKSHLYLRIYAVLVLSLFTTYSRYYLYYHSAQQCIVGYLLGMFIGYVWLKMADLARHTGFMNWLLNLQLCRLFLVKDLNYNVASEYDYYIASLNKKLN